MAIDRQGIYKPTFAYFHLSPYTIKLWHIFNKNVRIGSALFILHRVIPLSSDMGYTHKKGDSLHRGDNPARKNKRSARRKTRERVLNNQGTNQCAF